MSDTSCFVFLSIGVLHLRQTSAVYILILPQVVHFVRNSNPQFLHDFAPKMFTVLHSGQRICTFILDFPDPKETAEEVLISKDCLQKIADAVCIIHKEVPSQLFLDIFQLRYIKGYKQAEIASELNLSQSEISKRLMQLSKLISNFLDGSKS